MLSDIVIPPNSPAVPWKTIPRYLDEISQRKHQRESTKYHKLWNYFHWSFMSGMTDQDIADDLNSNRVPIRWVKKAMLGGKTSREILWNRSIQDVVCKPNSDMLFSREVSLIKFREAEKRKTCWVICRGGDRITDTWGKSYYYTDREIAVKEFVRLYPDAKTKEQMLEMLNGRFQRCKTPFITYLKANF